MLRSLQDDYELPHRSSLKVLCIWKSGEIFTFGGVTADLERSPHIKYVVSTNVAVIHAIIVVPSSVQEPKTSRPARNGAQSNPFQHSSE